MRYPVLVQTEIWYSKPLASPNGKTIEAMCSLGFHSMSEKPYKSTINPITLATPKRTKEQWAVTNPILLASIHKGIKAAQQGAVADMARLQGRP
jgi:hypothetical protein